MYLYSTVQVSVKVLHFHNITYNFSSTHRFRETTILKIFQKTMKPETPRIIHGIGEVEGGSEKHSDRQRDKETVKVSECRVSEKECGNLVVHCEIKKLIQCHSLTSNK